jgi:hypothetical protein
VRYFLLLLLCLLPGRALASPLTIEDVELLGVWWPSSPTLANLNTHGGNGAAIRFLKPYTGIFTFEHMNEEVWPIRWTPQFLERGTGDFATPCCGSAILDDTFEFAGGRPTLGFTRTSLMLENVGTIDFSVPGPPSSTLSLRNVTFESASVPAQVPVPEPATVTLLAVGVGHMLWRRRALSRRG